MNKKAVSANSFPCPKGKDGIVTVIVYEDGSIERVCTGVKKCETRWRLWCDILQVYYLFARYKAAGLQGLL